MRQGIVVFVKRCTESRSQNYFVKRCTFLVSDASIADSEIVETVLMMWLMLIIESVAL